MNRKDRAKIRRKKIKLGGQDLRTVRERTGKFILKLREIEDQFLSVEQKHTLARIARRKMAVRKLKQRRKTLGLNQSELSKLSGVPQATISRIERGIQNTSLSTLDLLADAMGCMIEIDLLNPPKI